MLLKNFDKFYNYGFNNRDNKYKGGSGTSDSSSILDIKEIQSLKVSELRSKLKNLKMDTKGLKDILQQRLLEYYYPTIEEEELFECENDCGFKGNFKLVEHHEKTCTFIKEEKSESVKHDSDSPVDDPIETVVSDPTLKKDPQLEVFKQNLEDNIFFEDPHKKDRTNLTEYKLDTMSEFPTFINDNSLNERDSKTNTLGTTGSNQGLNIKNWNNDTNQYDKIIPFRHQKFVIDYLNHNTPYRGLLLYHGLGSGKSGAAIMIAQGYPFKKTAILLPASLRNNFRDEIYKYGEISYKKDFFWINIPIDSENLKTNKKDYIQLISEKGMSEELFDLIISKISNSSHIGIWVVDPSRNTNNYHLLNDLERASLDKQIHTMVNYKYQFIHYNSGSYSVIGDIHHGNSVLNLLDDYQAFYHSIVGDKLIRDLTTEDQENLINGLFVKDKNPFNNKVVIIDEIHNFTAGIPGSLHKSRIYELLVRSKDSKLVFLSGTPVINKPYELALLFNMLKGIYTTYNVKLSKSSGSFDTQELSKLLDKNFYIDRFEIDQSNSNIIFTRVPNGFKKKVTESNVTFVKVSTPNNEKVFLNAVRVDLEKLGYTTISVIKNESTVFPDILSENSSIIGTRLISKLDGSDYKQLREDEFNQYYIDSSLLNPEEGSSNKKNLIKNAIAFKNRILGSVSFYNEVSSLDKTEIIFPEKKFASPDRTDVIMSDYQFILYSQARMIEKTLEDKIKKTKLSSANSGMVLSEPSSLFRVYTRQKGLFVFPPNIQRPMLMEVRLLDKLEKGIKKLIMSGSIDKYITDLLSFNIPEIDESSTKVDQQTLNKLTDRYVNHDNKNIIDYLDETVREILKQEKKIQEFTKNVFLIIFDLIYELHFVYTFDRDFIDIISSIKSEIRKSSIKKRDNNITVSDILIQLKEINLQDFLSAEQGTYGELCQQAIEKLTLDNLTVNDTLFNLRVLSPKYVKVLENIFNTKGPIVIYSQYRQVEGIETLSKTFKMNGYTQIDTKNLPIQINNDIIIGDMVRYTTDTFNSLTYQVLDISLINGSEKYTIRRNHNKEDLLDKSSEDELVVDKKEIHKCRFALWTGTESKEERDHILDLFNNQNNNLGNTCLILLITQSGAEGINLFCVRQVHILEPYWNNVRVNQVIGRARRVNSHKSLPDIHRNVEIFNYVIKFSEEQINGLWIDLIPDDIVFKIKKYENNKDAFRIENSGVSSFINSDKQGTTSDQVLVQISNEKEKLLSEFLNLMKEVAIDCNFNKESNINSNPELANIKCYDNPSDRVDKNYVLDIDVLNIKSKKQDLFTKTVTKKRETIPFQFLFNSSLTILNVFTILPPDIESWTDMRQDSDIYNWYRFNGLDPMYRNDFDKLNKIGTFKIIGSKQQFILDKTFRKNIKNYIKIHNCIDHISSQTSSSYHNIKSSNRVKQVKFNNLVFQCFDGTGGNWICPGCDSEYDYSIKMCVECEITREEVLETNNRGLEDIDGESEPSIQQITSLSEVSQDIVSQTTQEANLGKDTPENIKLEINESEDLVWKNSESLAKWWDQNGCDKSIANSGDTPNQIAQLHSLATKYEEDFQRNLQHDILSADDELLDRWNLTYVKDLIQDQGEQDESATQEANLGDTESGDSETSPVTQSVDSSTS